MRKIRKNPLHSIFFVVVFAVTLLCSGVPHVLASNYPSRPITIFIGYGSGGGTDLTARAITAIAGDYIPVPVQVVSITGASGSIAAAEVFVERPADGYSLFLSAPAAVSIVPITEDVPYSRKDYQGIALIRSIPPGFFVSKDSPFESFEEVIEYAKENPGKLTYSNAGLTTSVNTWAEAVQKEVGIDLVPVPYEGDRASIIALLGNHVDLAAIAHNVYFDYEDELRYLVSASQTPSLPEGIPTMAALGYDVPPISTWFGLLGRSDLPDEVVTYWEDVLKKIVQNPSFIGIMTGLGMDETFLPAKEFDAYLDAELAAFEEILTR